MKFCRSIKTVVCTIKQVGRQVLLFLFNNERLIKYDSQHDYGIRQLRHF